MKTKHLILIVGLVVFNFVGCQPCDDCQISPAPKQVTIVNTANQNLIFGGNAVYNPNNIQITNEFSENVEFFPNKTNGSLDFTFNVTATTYFIKLNVTETEKIVFTFGREKNPDCCNEFDVTKTTSVNGVEVSNSDEIKIVK